MRRQLCLLYDSCTVQIASGEDGRFMNIHDLIKCDISSISHIFHSISDPRNGYLSKWQNICDTFIENSLNRTKLLNGMDDNMQELHQIAVVSFRTLPLRGSVPGARVDQIPVRLIMIHLTNM